MQFTFLQSEIAEIEIRAVMIFNRLIACLILKSGFLAGSVLSDEAKKEFVKKIALRDMFTRRNNGRKMNTKPAINKFRMLLN